MESAREQRCRTCLVVFKVCRHCDHGQAYCRDACHDVARAAQIREAKRRYLADEDVREGERQRQRDYRARVRDQGSKEVAPCASVSLAVTTAPLTGGSAHERGTDDVEEVRAVGGLRPVDEEVRCAVGGLRPVDEEVRCAFCGRSVRFIRLGPLARRRPARWRIRARAP